MVLKADVMANPLANTTGHQGYIEPEKEVMQQVVRSSSSFAYSDSTA
jgi:hypothetical protein